MSMTKLSMCRICLVENVLMYVVANKNLQAIYEKLTDVPLVTGDRRPMLACYFCCTKLKQCWRLQRKCLEAEELFAQMLKEDYAKPQLYQDKLEFSGYTISRTEHVSTIDACQTENETIKEELPDVCEGQAVENETESEHENMQPYHIESEDIQAQHCKTEDKAHLIAFKTEVDQEQEDIPTQHSDSDSEDYVPLIKIYTGVDEEQLVSKIKRKANKTKRATAAKKLKKDMRRIKLEQQKETEKSDTMIIQKTESRTRNAFFEEHTGEKPYKCEICRRNFSAKNILKNHIRTHTGEKPYKCDICQQSFSKNCNLNVHIRRHTGDKPYKCDTCHCSFRVKASLIVHIRKHTGEKPYKCSTCQRSFGNKSDLRKHIRTHTGEKPYKCDVCQRSFGRKNYLTVHFRNHTGEHPYKCDICQRSFSTKSPLTRHYRTHTGEKPYKYM